MPRPGGVARRKQCNRMAHDIPTAGGVPAQLIGMRSAGAAIRPERRFFSAALRGALSAGVPTAVTPVTIFEEAGEAVHRFAGLQGTVDDDWYRHVVAQRAGADASSAIRMHVARAARVGHSC